MLPTDVDQRIPAQDDYNIASAVNLFLRCGVAIVAMTEGSFALMQRC
jgi:hypothetical protein